MFKKKIFLIVLTAGISSLSFATPHFYIEMVNLSQKDTTITFKPIVGDITLDPVLPDHTPLKAHDWSAKYGVNIPVLDPANNFDIVFTGKQDCHFNFGFYAPGNPKVTISGNGCDGGGYQMEGNTVIVYISDINIQREAKS